MKITGLSHLFKWDNLHNWWLNTFFAPLYIQNPENPEKNSLQKNAMSLQNISKVAYKLCQNISNYFCNTTLGIFKR